MSKPPIDEKLGELRDLIREANGTINDARKVERDLRAALADGRSMAREVTKEFMVAHADNIDAATTAGLERYADQIKEAIANSRAVIEQNTERVVTGIVAEHVRDQLADEVTRLADKLTAGLDAKLNKMFPGVGVKVVDRKRAR